MTFIRLRHAAVVVAVACGLSGAALAAAPGAGAMPALRTAAPAARGLLVTHVLVDCNGKGDVDPTSYVITCADGLDYLRSLSWTSWASTAHGTGRERINNCKPTCIKGTFHGYPVSVKLWRARSWPHHSGQKYYTRMTLRYTGKVPHGYHHTRVIHLFDFRP